MMNKKSVTNKLLNKACRTCSDWSKNRIRSFEIGCLRNMAIFGKPAVNFQTIYGKNDNEVMKNRGFPGKNR